MKNSKIFWVIVLILGICFHGYSQSFSNPANFSKEVKKWILISSYTNAYQVAQDWEAFYSLLDKKPEEKALLQSMFYALAKRGFNAQNLGFLLFRSYYSLRDQPEIRQEFYHLFQHFIAARNPSGLENLLINTESYFFNQTLRPIGNLYFRIGGKYDLAIDSSQKTWAPIWKFKNTSTVIFHAQDSLVLFFDRFQINLNSMDFEGEKGEIDGGDLGRIGETWRLAKFQFKAKDLRLTSDNSTWFREEEALSGSGEIRFVDHKKDLPFGINFIAQSPLSKPIEQNNFLLNGSFVLKNSQLSLIGENYSASLASKNEKIRLSTNEIGFDAEGRVKILDAQFFLKLGQSDSIIHPGVRAEYDAKSDILSLQSRDLTKVDQFLYQDSYHQLQISAEIAKLYPSENRIDFYRIIAKDQIPAWVESFDFFKAERIRESSQELTFDPFRVVYNYFVKNKKSTVYLDDLANYYKKNPASMKSAFYRFRDQGYFKIAQPGDLISFTRIGKNYAKAFFENKDYDEFIVPSFSYKIGSDSSNISLDFDKNQLKIRGVEEVSISDSLNAKILPEGNSVLFTEGRDFDFDGQIKLGNYQIFAKKSVFEFKDYAIDLTKIDSITFYPKLADGSYGKSPIGGELSYESGRLELLAPDNKSARKGLGNYPKLSIPHGLTAYFDQPWRANGAYHRGINLKVPSIYLDSLLTKDLQFKGEFTSGGLLNPIKTELTIQPDLSFGFTYKSSSNLDIYQKKAKIFPNSPLIMDQLGLHTSGNFFFKTLNIQSDNIQIFPDSLKSSGSQGGVGAIFNKKKLYPEIEIGLYQLRATKNLDSLIIQPLNSSLKFYQGEFNFNGSLFFHDDLYSGSGEIKIKENSIQSESIQFLPNNWQFNQAKVVLGQGKFALKPDIMVDQVQGKAQVGAGKLSLLANGLGGENKILYPKLNYQSDFEEGIWDWGKNTFDIKSKNRILFSPAIYQKDSTERDTTKLVEGYGDILAKSGSYDFIKEELNLNGVENVRIGPSLIFPDQGKFGIKKGGQFLPFSHAKAILDADNDRHYISDLMVTRADPSIFKGAGNYLLGRPSGDSIKIMFTQFDILGDPTIKGASYLEAKARFGEKSSLAISKFMDFKGEILLKSNEPFLQFSGFIKPNLGLSNFKSSWIPFEPKPGTEPVLKVDENLVDEFGNPLTVGLFVNSQNKLYPTFLGAISDDLDPILFKAKGVLKENASSLSVESETGIFTLDIPKKRVEAEGEVQLFTGNELVRAMGNIEMSTDTLIPRVNAWLSLQFPFKEEILKAMGERIVKFNIEEGLLSTSADEPEDRDEYLKRVKNILKGEPLSEATLNMMDKAHLPLNKANEKFNQSINFSKVQLKWLPNTGAFYSAGNMSLVNVGPVDVNNLIKGYLEIIKRPSKEEFYGYWELSEKLWYYFAYFDGEMGVYSSDFEFLSRVRAAVNNEKNKNDGGIKVVEAASDEKDVFLKRFFTYYKQKEEPKKEPPKAEPSKTKAPSKKISKGGF